MKNHIFLFFLKIVKIIQEDVILVKKNIIYNTIHNQDFVNVNRHITISETVMVNVSPVIIMKKIVIKHVL